MDPITLMAIAGLTQVAGNVLPRVIGKKKREARVDAAGKTFTTPREYKDNVEEARAQIGAGDPNYNRNVSNVRAAEANAIDRTKNVTGNVGDILSMIQGLNRTSTDRQLAAGAHDTEFRLNARRYLSQARSNFGQANQQTQRSNFAAQQAEIGRQQQNINQWSQASGNVANDFVSANLLKNYNFLGSGGMGV